MPNSDFTTFLVSMANLVSVIIALVWIISWLERILAGKLLFAVDFVWSKNRSLTLQIVDLVCRQPVVDKRKKIRRTLLTREESLFADTTLIDAL